ncbi:MAG TPA: hypothetical protein VFJ13_08685, partial [Paracoccaceae bacterium]|nr:hypothetical protein [Paracoccaceae bacterium]
MSIACRITSRRRAGSERTDIPLPTSPSPRARLLGLATATPPHRLDQDAVVDEAGRLFGAGENFERLRPVFANTGIRTRWSARPLDWFRRPQDWPSRSEAYLDAAPALFAEAARAALDEAGLEAARVDTVVTVSTTGIATPSLEARALETLGLREDVRRVPVFGLGCAGGAGGLALTAWALRRSGMRPREVADRTLVFLCLTYVVYMGALVLVGVGLYA